MLRSIAVRFTATTILAAMLFVSLVPSAFAAVARYEETAPSVLLTGPWDSVSAVTSSAGLHVKAEAPASAVFSFTGTAVSWIGHKGPFQGLSEVRIDSGAWEQVDASAADVAPQSVLVTKSGLANGPHTLEVRRLGLPGANGTGSTISIDAFDVTTPDLVSTPASAPWSIALLMLLGTGLMIVVRRRTATTN